VAVGAGRVQESVKTLWTYAKPRSTGSLLAARLAERSGADEGLSGVRPAVRVGAMGVVVVQVRSQACDEFLGRGEVAALEPATRQRAKPQFDLVEPRAVFGREVEHMLVFGVRQEGTSLLAGVQVAVVERQAVQPSHEFANVEAPVCVQVVEGPMEPLVVGELRRDMGQMSGEIQAGACYAQIPDDFACGDDERGDQAARAVTDIFVFTLFGFARLGEDRGMLALKNLHAGLFVTADNQLAVLIQGGSLDVQLTDVLSLGVEVGIVAVEPVDAAVRLQISGIQDTPDGGARHRIVGVPIDQDGRKIVKAPLAGNARVSAGFASGERDDFELFVGGKSDAADPTSERLAVPRDPAGENVFAIESRYCGCTRTRWQPADWKADSRPPTARSAGTERPKLAAWNGLALKLPTVLVPRGPRQSAEQMGVA
jgi:hypothetical protein